MQSATSRSVAASHEIAQTIAQVSEIATTIAAAVEAQGNATEDIARNVQQASAGTAEVSDNIVSVSQASQLTGTAAAQVLASAGELSKNGEALKTQVEVFLREVRAA
jgi:methyl-accepting chemotaxis protein